MYGSQVHLSRLARLPDEAFDVVVIGGGIIGAGIARDASLRGLRVALFEKQYKTLHTQRAVVEHVSPLVA